jgi:hypothetical protein
MTNYAGQTICNSMENLIQHKFIVMKEAIPQEQDYIEALNDIQRASTVVVNAFNENNPDQPIPNPIREVQNIPLPPEVMAAFQFSNPMAQAILGSFTSNQNQQNANLSGKAVIESASADNAAAMPFVVGYLAASTQWANIIVDLMPKYILGKRVIPVEDKGGEKKYQEVNSPNNAMINYDEKAIKVNIDAGVNFQVQKSQAMTQIIGLMQASEEFGKFMNSEQGLNILVKNLTIYGADELQEAVPKWLQAQQQQQQQQMQMAQQAAQNDPRMIKAQADMAKVQSQNEIDKIKMQLEAMKLQMEQQQQEIENQITIAKVANEKILNDAKLFESEAKVNQMQIDSAVRLEESQTSLEVHSLEAATKMAEIQSRQHRDNLATHELKHKIEEAKNAKV